MSVRPGPLLRRRVHRHAASLAGALALCVAVAGCSPKAQDQAAPKAEAGSSSSASPSPTAPPTSAATITTNVATKGVKVDKVVKLTAKDGTFDSVVVHAGKKPLAGALLGGKTAWSSTAPLQAVTTS